MYSMPFNISSGIKAVLAGILKTNTINRKQFMKRIIKRTIISKLSIKRFKKFLKPESSFVSSPSILSFPGGEGIIFPISPGIALIDSTTLLKSSGNVVAPRPSKLERNKGIFAIFAPIPANKSDDIKPRTNSLGRFSIIRVILVNKSLKPIEVKLLKRLPQFFVDWDSI